MFIDYTFLFGCMALWVRTFVLTLNRWITSTSGAIKICVSSREENIFLDKYSSTQRMRLQDLTKTDMPGFVYERLSPHASQDGFQRFIDQIFERSDGVFFWVTLVTKAMRQKLDNRHPLASIERELDVLPKELGGPYEHLLSAISETESRRAHRLLAMVQSMEQCRSKVSATSCLYLDQFESDLKFAIKGLRSMPTNVTILNSGCRRCFDSTKWFMVQHTYQEGYVHLGYDQQCSDARALVQAYCKGLIEVRELSVLDRHGNNIPNDRKGAMESLRLVHRTIVEFLKKKDNSAIMKDNLQGFNAIEAISQVHLADLVHMHPDLIDATY
jgi:hypothetical protein